MRGNPLLPKLWGLTVALLLLAPGAWAAPSVGAAPAPRVPADAWTLLRDALVRGNVTSPLPTTVSGLLGATPRELPVGDGWSAYEASLGLAPTPDEARLIAQFAADHPALSASLDRLLAEVADAKLLRDQAFARLTPVAMAQLRDALDRIAAGAAPSAQDDALLAAIDFGLLTRAAAHLDAATTRARADLVDALAQDAARSRPALVAAHPEALDDPAALLALLADDAAPHAPASVATGLRALGAPGVASTLPPDLDRALGTLLVALADARRAPSAAAADGVVATTASVLPALVRASYNLSVVSSGDLAAYEHRARPGLAPRGELADVDRFIADAVGPATARAPNATFLEGLARLHAALGTPWDADARAAAAQLEQGLGPARAAALGNLLAAQAAYQSDFATSSPLAQRMLRDAAAAAPILARGDAITLSDLRILEESYRSQMAWRQALALDTHGVLAAAEALSEAHRADATPIQVPTGVAYEDGDVVVLGAGATRLTTDEWQHAPTLLVDLGGDDDYAIPLAGVVVPQADVTLGGGASITSVAIDLGGADTYEPPARVALGGAQGVPGSPAMALLLDAQGDDRYVAPDAALGWSVDGTGIALDLAGNDDYAIAGAGAGDARTTSPVSTAFAILFDAAGNDRYTSGSGFAHLEGTGGSKLTVAAFVDLLGVDTFRGDCPQSELRYACFGGPRMGQGENDSELPRGCTNTEIRACYYGTPVNSSVTQGVAVFLDPDGVDVFPAGHPAVSLALDANPTAPRQIVMQASPITPGGLESIDTDTTDTNGDGYPDVIDHNTDFEDPRTGTFGLPEPLPEAPEVVPETPFTQRHANDAFLLDFPGIVKIGGPGVTTYNRTYLLTLDLGVNDPDRYLNDTAVGGIAIDAGGNDLYAPVASDESRESIAAALTTTDVVGILVDLGGNDVYRADIDAEAVSSGSSANLAILLDAQGNDRYTGGNRSMAFAQVGRAYLLDLSGNDVYTGPSQGVAEQTGGNVVAFFLDAETDKSVAGVDVYTNPTVGSAADPDAWQGVARVPDASLAGYEFASSGTFFDLAGQDVYRARDANALYVDVSAQKNNAFHLQPTDSPSPGRVGMFLDLASATADSDVDGSPDLVELVGGTSPTNAGESSEDPNANAPNGFVLNLPRLGVGVGSLANTAWTRDYAVQIDLGGDDAYTGRAGASSPQFPVSVCLDVGSGTDRYVANGTAPLSAFFGSTTLGGAEADVVSSARLGSAQGAGVLGVGELVDDGGFNAFALNATATGEGLRVLGASQGAGVLGVGILRLGGGNDVRAYAAVDGTGSAPAWAETLSQGAGFLGVGILSSEALDGFDAYTLEAEARGASAANATSGQGFALHGLGALLDAGGDNRLVARNEAQAATILGTQGFAAVPASLAGGDPATRLSGSLGALLLHGAGNDTLVADARSQAYARGGLAILYDAAGADTRVLHGQDGVADGQAASRESGVALLLDAKGDDLADAAGTRAQGYAAGGIAMLVDLAGDDTYRARDLAQGVGDDGARGLSSLPAAVVPWPSFAAFADRRGHDTYVITPDALLAQGATAPTSQAAAALFLDLGGQDRYQGVASGHVADERSNERAPDGNEWRWSDGKGHGADTDFAGSALASIESALAPTFGAQLRAEGDGGALVQPLSGNVTLAAWIGTPDAEPAPGEGALLDRASFYFDGVSVGAGALRVDGRYTLGLDTLTLDAEGKRIVPDGRHQVTAEVYLAQGAPTDAEPLMANTTLSVDNPPIARPPELPALISTANGPVHVRTWIDRDLEAGVCGACDGLAYVQPAPDEWATLAQPDPAGASKPDAACNIASCLPVLSVANAAGNGYLSWQKPAQDAASILGYRVWRLDAEGAHLLAFLDPRAPTRWMDRGGVVGTAAISYRVDALRGSLDAPLAASATASTTPSPALPAPASGLAAQGTEGGVYLAWRPAEGATSYSIQRVRADHVGASVTLGPVDGTTFTDTGAPTDAPMAYVVTPRNAAGAGVSSLPAMAQASPGPTVGLALEGPTDVAILDHAPVGGAQTLDVRLPAGLPDGDYRMLLDETDAAGHTARWNGTFVLDGTAPTTRIDLPEHVGGAYTRGGALRVPFHASDATGAAWTWAFLQQDGAWLAPFGPVNASLGAIELPQPPDGVPFRVVLLSVDAVGNVEGLRTPRPYAATIEDGFRDVLAAGLPPTHVLDTAPPKIVHEDLRFDVRPGTAVPVSAAAFDPAGGSGLASVSALVGPDVVPLARESDGLYHGTYVANGNGTMAIRISALDAAGNEGNTAVGTMVVDGAAPYVTDAVATFGDGRALAHPGDVGHLAIRADDPNNATAPGALAVEANLSNISSLGVIRARWDAGAGAYQVDDFPVDRVPAVGRANVSLSLLDPAGNLGQAVITVAINGTRANLSAPDVTVSGASGATIRWSSTSATFGRVDYGLTPQLDHAAAEGSTTRLDHLVALRDLVPDSDYFARAVALTEGGIETRGPIFQFHTGHALSVALASPLVPVRNETTFALRVTRFDGAPVTGTATAYLTNPRTASVAVAAGDVVAGLARLHASLDSFRDGAYDLTFTVTDADGFTVDSAPQKLVLDSTPPLLDYRGPTTLASHQAVSLRVQERGAGLDFENITWTFAGVPCAPLLDEDTLSCSVPETARGEARLVALVPDRAGNVGRLSVPIVLADLVGTAARAVLESDAGTPFVAPGAGARLRVVGADEAVRRVVADLSPLGGPHDVRLARGADGAFEATFTVSRSAQDGPVTIPLVLADAGGNELRTSLEGTVDASPAKVTHVDANPLSYASVELSVVSTRPTRVVVQGPDARDDDFRNTHTLRLAAPQPGVPFTITLTTIDQGGRKLTQTVEIRPLPDEDAPSAVRGLRVEDYGNGHVRVAWDPATDDVSGVAGYRIERTIRALTTPMPNATQPGFADDIPAQTVATYTVRAIDRAGNVGPAQVAQVSSAALATLRDGAVTPAFGGPGVYRFSVRVDAPPGAANVVNVIVDGVVHPMSAQPGCAAPCEYSALVELGAQSLGSGPHAYAFQSTAGGIVSSYPAEGKLQGPTVVAGAPAPTVPGVSGASRIPMLGVASALATLAGLVVVGQLIRRKKR